MRKQPLFIGFLLLGLQSFGQTDKYNTCARINLSSFTVPNSNDPYKFRLKQMGLSISHSFKKHWALTLSYNVWTSPYSDKIKLSSFTEGLEMKGENYVGKIENHKNYQMIDVIPGYFLSFGSSHHFYGGLGYSYQWGVDGKITKLYQEPGYPDVLIEITNYQEAFHGIAANAGYNYSALLHGRLSLGASIKYRYYFNSFTQTDFSLEVGYNFNSFRKLIK